MNATPIDLGNVRLVAERNALSAFVDEQQETIRRMIEEIKEARRLLNAGVEIMEGEQVGKWEGVRAWLEGVDSDQDPHDAAFPRNPERDANGNAVLYPGMTRYEGAAGIFGSRGEREFVVLAPTFDALKSLAAEYGFGGTVERGACRIASLEPLPNTERSGASSAAVTGSGKPRQENISPQGEQS